MPVAVTNFFDWFLSELPAFLMREPIIYFWGVFFVFAVVALLRRIINITR